MTLLETGNIGMTLFFAFIALPLLAGLFYLFVIILRVAFGVAWRLAFGFLAAGFIGYPLTIIVANEIGPGSLKDHLVAYDKARQKNYEDGVKYLSYNEPVLDFCTSPFYVNLPFCASMGNFSRLDPGRRKTAHSEMFYKWVKKCYIYKQTRLYPTEWLIHKQYLYLLNTVPD